MPLIRKRRIWWESVPGAKEYVLYVSLEEKLVSSAGFAWEETTGLISKVVSGKTDLIIPDEWPDFPERKGTYYIAITACNNVGNQSDPLLLSGEFDFTAPLTPAKGGIETVKRMRQKHQIQPEVNPQIEPHAQSDSPHSPPPFFDHEKENTTLIQRGLKELDNHQDLGDAYLG